MMRLMKKPSRPPVADWWKGRILASPSSVMASFRPPISLAVMARLAALGWFLRNSVIWCSPSDFCREQVQ